MLWIRHFLQGECTSSRHGTFSYWILYSTFLTLSNIAYMSECIWNNIITATAVFRARPGGSLPSAPGPAGHRGRHGPEQERRHGEGRVRGGGGAQAGVPGPAAAALPPPLTLPDVPLRLGWMFCSFSSKRFSESHINNGYTHTSRPPVPAAPTPGAPLPSILLSPHHSLQPSEPPRPRPRVSWPDASGSLQAEVFIQN